MNTLLFTLFFSINIFLGNTFDESGLEEYDYECMKELNVTADFVINGFDQYNFLREGDAQLNEFVNCTWHKSGYLTGDGEINPDRLKAWLEVDLIKKNSNPSVTAEGLVTPCRSTTGVDSGDKAVKVYNCLVRTLWGV